MRCSPKTYEKQLKEKDLIAIFFFNDRMVDNATHFSWVNFYSNIYISWTFKSGRYVRKWDSNDFPFALKFRVMKVKRVAFIIAGWANVLL